MFLDMAFVMMMMMLWTLDMGSDIGQDPSPSDIFHSLHIINVQDAGKGPIRSPSHDATLIPSSFNCSSELLSPTLLFH